MSVDKVCEIFPLPPPPFLLSMINKEYNFQEEEFLHLPTSTKPRLSSPSFLPPHPSKKKKRFVSSSCRRLKLSPRNSSRLLLLSVRTKGRWQTNKNQNVQVGQKKPSPNNEVRPLILFSRKMGEAPHGANKREKRRLLAVYACGFEFLLPPPLPPPPPPPPPSMLKRRGERGRGKWELEGRNTTKGKEKPARKVCKLRFRI